VSGHFDTFLLFSHTRYRKDTRILTDSAPLYKG